MKGKACCSGRLLALSLWMLLGWLAPLRSQVSGHAIDLDCEDACRAKCVFPSSTCGRIAESLSTPCLDDSALCEPACVLECVCEAKCQEEMSADVSSEESGEQFKSCVENCCQEAVDNDDILGSASTETSTTVTTTTSTTTTTPTTTSTTTTPTTTTSTTMTSSTTTSATTTPSTTTAPTSTITSDTGALPPGIIVSGEDGYLD